jgi:hypothetical protein
VFLEHTETPLPAGYRLNHYIVLEKTDNPHPRIPAYAEAQELAKHATLVHEWNGNRGRKEVAVQVWALPFDAFPVTVKATP